MSAWNYFNYFTEIEEYFWKKRGANLLVSPLDWAIMEAWQQDGVKQDITLFNRTNLPIALALLMDTSASMETRLQTAQEAAAGGHSAEQVTQRPEVFSRKTLREHFAKNARQIEHAAADVRAAHPELSARLTECARSQAQCSAILESPAVLDLEDLERRLTVLDDKIQSVLLQHADEELLLRLRREVDGQLAMYRGKMRREQIALVGRQYLQKCLLEEFRLPRLSLFYLQH